LRQAYDYWQDQPGSFVQFPADADRIEPQKQGRETKAQRGVKVVAAFYSSPAFCCLAWEYQHKKNC